MKKGFTLIELMIVIAIIAILAAIAVPSFGRMKDKAAVQSAARSVEGLKYALEVYEQEPDNNGLLPVIDSISGEQWLDTNSLPIPLDMSPTKLTGTMRELWYIGTASGFTLVGKPKLNDTVTWVWVHDSMNNAEHNYKVPAKDATATAMKAAATVQLF